MQTFLIALRALVYAIAALLLLAWVVLGVRSFDRGVGMWLPAWVEWPGVTFIAAGGILALVCFGVFIARGRGTPFVADPPQEFVAAGPYKYVRNPIYIGQVAVLVGLGLYLRSVSILVFALLWFVLLHLFVVYLEEPNLRKKFGATYEGYCQAVRRWIPSVASAKGK